MRILLARESRAEDIANKTGEILAPANRRCAKVSPDPSEPDRTVRVAAQY